MAVLCAKCGEELLGAINRCWRCGTEYESRSGDIEIPPLRRAPVASLVPPAPAELGSDRPPEQPDAPLEAILIDANSVDVAQGGSLASGAPRSVDARHQGPQAMRRGSPFRSSEIAADNVPVTDAILNAPPNATKYPKFPGATAGPAIATGLGLLSLGLAYPVPIAAVILSAVGLGLGVWGLYSKNHKAAILGLLICCGAIAVSGFFAAADVYRVIHGHAPWEQPIYPAP